MMRIKLLSSNTLEGVIFSKKTNMAWWGVDRSSISQWLSNKTKPSKNNLNKLASLLDVPADDLIADEAADGVHIHSPNNTIYVNQHIIQNINLVLPENKNDMLKIIREAMAAGTKDEQ